MMRKAKTLILHTQDNTRHISFSGEPLLMDVLRERGILFAHPCGGRGVCRKCAVEARGHVSSPDAMERAGGVRLSCRMRLLGDCEVTLREMDGFDAQTMADTPSVSSLTMAADIGTTTLDIRLYDSQTGALAAQAAALNPQANMAADVVGRITAALEGKGEAMRRQLLQALQRMMAGQPPVERAVITGNTVMLYLLTGQNPQALAAAPFTPDCLFGYKDTILGIPAYLPRCIGAFTGADLTCAMLASGMTESTDSVLLCDIGTNGEMALWHKGRLFVTSAASGPAFEGVGISCGMGGVPGAIDKVWAMHNALDVHVIGGGRPHGICGSGLLDAVAALLQLDWVDATGAMEGDTVPVADGVVLTRQDIRQVQLAKAAVAAGLEILLDTAGITPLDIRTLYIAGGFGSHLNPRSAAAIGLFPLPLAPKARVLGNAALTGAGMLLQNEQLRKKADDIARMAQAVPLSGNPRFAEKYLRHMNFPDT